MREDLRAKDWLSTTAHCIWYSLAALDGVLYAVEPNYGELNRSTPGGIVTRLADISDSQGPMVPTGIAYHDGNFLAAFEQKG